MSRDAVVAEKVKAAPVTWLWRDRFPEGMISLVAGKPDQGKGLLAAHVAAEVSRMGKNVLYSAIEDDPARMTRPRLEAAGANLKRVLLWRFQLPRHMEQLSERVVADNIKLVVIDPLAAHLSGGVGRHSDSIRSITTPVSELCEATGCSFLIIEHMLKRVTKSADPLSMIGGSSSGLPAASRMAFLFGSDPKDRDKKLLASVKSNLRERPKTLLFEVDVEDVEDVENVAYLMKGEETEAGADVLLQKGEDGVVGRPPDKRAAAAEWLARLLFENGKMTAKQVYEDAKHVPLSSRTVRRATDDLGIIKDPPGGGAKCTWELPPELVQALKDAHDEAKKGSKK